MLVNLYMGLLMNAEVESNSLKMILESFHPTLHKLNE